MHLQSVVCRLLPENAFAMRKWYHGHFPECCIGPVLSGVIVSGGGIETKQEARGYIAQVEHRWCFELADCWQVCSYQSLLLLNPRDSRIPHPSARLLLPNEHLLPCSVASMLWTRTPNIA